MDIKRISILGSTGSIGGNTLRIVEAHPERFQIMALAARRNADELFRQARKFRPELVCLYETAGAPALEKKLKRLGIRLVTGDEGLLEASIYHGVDQVLFSLVGAVGLVPIFSAVRAGKSVAVANKEPLVMAGQLLLKECKARGVSIFPIDSEHSALWQCLQGHPAHTVKKLILTSSGGPFRSYQGAMAGITAHQALRHPKWKMGPKISIDSATLMNKGLEVIEASNLFGVGMDKIEVLIHPEAIVHAMIEFVDGSHLAHLGITDMRLPIQYALSYPERLMNHLPTLDLTGLGGLHFEHPKRRRFPCLDLGYEAGRAGGTMPSVMNAANEIAVEKFLGGRIGFTAIPKVIAGTMKRHRLIADAALGDILAADRWARDEARGLCASGMGARS